MAERTVHRRGGILAAAASLAIAGGAVLLARGSMLEVKARAAAVLIDAAWSARLRDGRPHRPWPWADFTPVARLRVPRLRLDRPVLSDATGRTLAFGLGHVGGTAAPGESGLSAVAGHRDSWGAFLRDLRDGDEVVVTTPDGERSYTIVARQIVDRRIGVVPVAGERDALVLITCWPFDGLRPGPLRFVVTGRPRSRGGGREAGQFRDDPESSPCGSAGS